MRPFIAPFGLLATVQVYAGALVLLALAGAWSQWTASRRVAAR